MNWVDIIIVIILVTSGLRGLSRGFIVSLFSLVGFFASIYIAKLYYPVVVRYIYSNSDITRKIHDFIHSRIFSVIGNNDAGGNTKTFLEYFNLPESIKEGLGQGLQLQMESGSPIDAAGTFLADKFTYLFITIISIIIIFLAARLILMIVVNLLDLIAKLPVLNFFNRTIGLVFGLVKGILLIFIIFTLLTPVISMFPEGFIAHGTLDSVLGSYFYTHNFIIDYLNNGFGLSIN